MRRPGDTAVGVDQHPRRRLPGPRNGLVGHRSRSRPTSPFCISTRSQNGTAFVVRRPTSYNCVHFTHFRLPRKKSLVFSVPRHAKLQKKTTTDQDLVSLHPCCARASTVFPVPTPDSRPSRRARSARGWLLHSGTGTQEERDNTTVTRHQAGEADNEQRSLERTHWIDTVR